MANQFEHLLSPMQIGNLTIKNRLCVAPMGEGYHGLAGPHGEYSELGIEHIVQRAKGGFGLVFLGCTAFPDNKVDPHSDTYNVLTHKDSYMKQGHRLNDRCAVYDTKLFQQVTLGLGRNDPGNYSCSPLPEFYFPNITTPELTVDQIHQKVDCVVEMAELCKNSGFAGVEIHALHWGYLLDQFAMSLTNHRTDEYGGSLENRLRVCKEIIEGVKQVCGSDFPVSMRLGLKSYIKGLNKPDLLGKEEAGRTLEEGLRIAQLMESYGYDCLSVDVGTYDSFYYAIAPSYMPQGHVIDLAAKCKEVVNIPVLCGSRMNDPFMNEKAIADGKVDAVVIGRQSLADPDYGKKLEMGKPEKIRPCIGCLVGCMNRLQTCANVTCAVNPSARREGNYHIEKTMTPKKVAVIGGGIAGMEAARIAKLRGHDVTIYERSGRLGGLLNAAGAPSFKKETLQLMHWYINDVQEMGIPVVLNADMTAEKLKELAPDAVIMAMGSGSLMPKSIQGIEHPKAVSFIDAHEAKETYADDKKIVVIGGGLVGCETALDFAMDGKEVTVVDAAPAILGASKMLPLMVHQMIPDLLDYYKVNCMPGYQIDAINDQGAVISPTDGGDPIQLEANHVIIAIGRKRANSFAQDLFGSGIEVYSVGDMNEVGNVYTSVTAAYEVARSL